MATIAIPLISAFAPTIIDLIAGLVHRFAPVQEANLGAGTGPSKLGNVFGDVIAALNSAAVAGVIEKALPSDTTILTIIQAVVSSMKLSGQLGSTVTPVVPVPGAVAGTQSLALHSGQSITITVA